MHINFFLYKYAVDHAGFSISHPVPSISSNGFAPVCRGFKGRRELRGLLGLQDLRSVFQSVPHVYYLPIIVVIITDIISDKS